MPRGDKSSYTDKQKRKAEHIEQGYEDRGVPAEEAEKRAWATVNKESGGGNKSGSGRGKPDTHVSSSRGGKANKAGSAEQRSASARKGWVTRRKNAKKLSAAETHALRRVLAGGGDETRERALAVETPVAIEIDGLGHAVMMASPADLVDFAYGFALSERLVSGADGIVDVDVHEVAGGTLLRLTLDAPPAEPTRTRRRTGDASCGLCGIENLEQAMRPLPRVAPGPAIPDAAIFRALGLMRARQPLNAATGAVHAAIACDAEGNVLLSREDVGRHNAFDKLIGAMLRAGLSWEGRFALLSSRCSYELVEKAALAGCATLVTVSAPTSLALARARAAGVRLAALARADSFLQEVGIADERAQDDARLVPVE